MDNKAILKQVLYDLFNTHEDAEDIVEALRSLVSIDELTKPDYDTILEHYNEWLGEWQATAH